MQTALSAKSQIDDVLLCFDWFLAGESDLMSLPARGLVELTQAAAKIGDRKRVEHFLKALNSAIEMKQFDLSKEDLEIARGSFNLLLQQRTGW